MKKRIISLMLAAATLMSMTSCGTKKASKDDAFENAPVVTFATKNYYEANIGKAGDDVMDNPYIRYVYEKTGVRLQPVLLSANQSEADQQMAVKRAGGEQIDIILNWDIQQAYMQSGLIITLNDLLEQYKDKIPNIMANIPESGWSGMKKKEQIWGIPGRYVLPNPSIAYIFLRKDWMDKLNLDMPETTDDLGNILRAFTEEDPDGNGVKDTFGMAHEGEQTVTRLLQLFGCDSWNEQYVNGRLMNGATTNVARKAFSVLRSWDQAGYINRDGIADSKAHDTLVSTNKIGAIIGTAAKIDKYTTTLHENGFADAEWVMPTTQIKSSIDGIFWGRNSTKSNHATAAMITSMAKDYDSIFKVLDWFYSEEGTFFQSWGLEGREYKMVDGKPVRNEDYISSKSYLNMFEFGKSYNHYWEELAYSTYGDNQFAKDYINETINNFNNYVGASDKINLSIKFDYPDLPEFTTYPDWRKGVATNMMKFVTGDLDPANDSVWNTYLSECDSYGLNKLLDAALKAYNEDTERPDKIDLSTVEQKQ